MLFTTLLEKLSATSKAAAAAANQRQSERSLVRDRLSSRLIAPSIFRRASDGGSALLRAANWRSRAARSAGRGNWSLSGMLILSFSPHNVWSFALKLFPCFFRVPSVAERVFLQYPSSAARSFSK